MIQIYSPASIGNIIVGFDILGAAIKPINTNHILGDVITIKKSKNIQISNIGRFSHNISNNNNKNIVYYCWKKFCQIIQKKVFLYIKLEKNLPIKSGLGSSASSIASTLFGINTVCKNILNQNKLLLLMGKVEKKFSGEMHLDNVAPSFLGGIQLILNKKKFISQRIPEFKNWFWIIAYPGTKISTYKARKILPKKYKRQDCIKYGQNLSGFIHATYTNQQKLAIKMMKDVISEKFRISLISNFKKIKNHVKNLGAINFGISGSGPTLFAISDKIYIAKNISKWLKKNYILNKYGFVYICCIDTLGTRIL